jgi:hypothetical protein
VGAFCLAVHPGSTPLHAESAKKFDLVIRSSRAAVLWIIFEPISCFTWREAPQRQHRSSRGRPSALTTPTWPHWQAILIIM